MPTRVLHLPAPPARVAAALDSLRGELDIPVEFPPAALAEAADAAARPLPDLPDARDLPLVTIDPPGSRDLDQAVHLEEDGEGLVVHYAIADVASFVTPGGALDEAVRARGVTVYGPTGSLPLHPETLSAGAASLLPGQDRPSYLWRIALDDAGEVREATVRRALVRSRAQLTYEQVQAVADGASDPAVPDALPALLRRVGELRLARERERGGVSLEIPEQDIVDRDGGYALTFRATLPVEEWNAQVSLLTGIVAAGIMTDAGVGILRTLPPADPRDLARLRRTARALGIDWPADDAYPDLLPTLDSARPSHAAFLNQATTLFRGADYAVLGAGGGEPQDEEDLRHAALAARYAHVTAPLRRLVDRFGLEVCRAACAGEPVPAWVLEALPSLPRAMARATQRAGRYERGAVDAVEALVLEPHLGQTFRGVVVDVDDDGARVVLADPAVEARVEAAGLPLGEEITVRLTEVDVPTRTVRFSPG
ncbi:RNB domain-containing ribonuclease [Georgenia sp. 311]|uniref:RNB domain-containing ribonuclease n=1 Tax=Georgenia sp. 311 TaxID=2585134 RepID=UPI001111B5ED|nr:RNB domain-containing ribonuclease [Georgenia sp. 311]TNC21373.1 RNB domain-containing ribonuclease [Georgenia sp. 311]